jgi:FkbM family methyltransferase
MPTGPARALEIATHASGLNFVRYRADRGMGRWMAKGAFEVAELACATRLVQAGDVVIDGGAHLGAYTLPLAQKVGPGGHVHAFEPHPDSVAVLTRAVALNGFETRVSVWQVALGATPSPGVLRSRRACSGHGHAWLETGSGRIQALQSERRIGTRIVALDDTSIQGRVRLIKLDVEGAEFLALQGAARMIRRHRPFILCDVGDEALARVSGAPAVALMQTLVAVDYVAHHILPDGLVGPPLDFPSAYSSPAVLFLPR